MLLETRSSRCWTLDNDSLTLGYAGVYSSFLRHTRRVAAEYDLDPREILVELGEIGVVGGQENIITDVAEGLSTNIPSAETTNHT